MLLIHTGILYKSDLDPAESVSGSGNLEILNISKKYILFKGSATICILLQRRVLKLDELGEKAKTIKDLVSDADRRGKRYEKAINDYVRRLFVKKNGGLL
jgi:hypothetical protein